MNEGGVAVCLTASQQRSVPLRQVSAVMTAGMPEVLQKSSMRVSSVATTYWQLSLCRQMEAAMSATRRIISTPAILTRGLPGRRVEA